MMETMAGVWEEYKESLKVWEKENPANQEDVKWEELEGRQQKQTHHRDLRPEA